MGVSLTARKPAMLLHTSGPQGKVAQVSFKFDICHHVFSFVKSPTSVLVFYSDHLFNSWDYIDYYLVFKLVHI